jgi:uncharacterized membrane protein
MRRGALFGVLAARIREKPPGDHHRPPAAVAQRKKEVADMNDKNDNDKNDVNTSDYGGAYGQLERSDYQGLAGMSDYGMNHDGRNVEADGTDWGTLALGMALTGTGLYLIVRALGGPGAKASVDTKGVGTKGVGTKGQGVEVRESVTVNKSADELYRYWRELTNLPQIMRHLEAVEAQGGNRSHWVAKAPLGTKVAWDAEITEDVPGSRIAWRSLQGSQIPNEGSVAFRAAPGGRGTEVHVHLKYQPPLGPLGATVAKLFGEEPSQQISEDLRRFKQRMETGEIATTHGQPSGRDG